MLVGLEHGMLICMSMELQRRSGSQSESEISIGKYGVCILGFVFYFVLFIYLFFLWISDLVFL